MTTTTTTPDVVATARALRPQIEAFSAEAERTRRLPDGLVLVLRESGLFGMARPVDLGGAGVDLITSMRAIEEVSYADASAGWCTAIDSGTIGLPPIRADVLRQIYKPGVSVCGVGAPTGRALPVDGGYRLSGRWAYASGCLHSEWTFIGAVAFDGDKPRTLPGGFPEFRICMVPLSEVEIIDTWHVAGLRGTGSNDIVVSDLFVPEERTAPIMIDGAPGSDGAAYRIPMFTLFGLGLTPVALGAARRAIDELISMAQGKTPMLSPSKLREKPVAQHEIARAEGMLQGGRSYLYEMVAALMDRASREEPIDMEMRARVKLSVTHATDAAAQATEIAYRLGGATANFESSILQRCMRDVNAVTQHFMVAPTNYETVGRVLMGLDPGTPTI